MEDNVIEIGDSPLAPYVAFGDESKFADTLVYAQCVFKRSDIRSVEVRLRKIKSIFGIPEAELLHMSALMNPFQRQKRGMANLTNEDVKSLVVSVLDDLAGVQYLLKYSFYRISDGETQEFPDDESGIPLVFEQKGILGVLCQGAYIAHPNGSEGPHPRECEIIISEEKTKIRFAGTQKTRADRGYSGYLDIGAPAGKVYRVRPRVVASDSVPLLQLGDLFSYLCSHARSPQCGDPFYGQQLARVKNRVERNLNLQLASGKFGGI